MLIYIIKNIFYSNDTFCKEQQAYKQRLFFILMDLLEAIYFKLCLIILA